jgi:uncharacterized protein YdcH (DUF465 family)
MRKNFSIAAIFLVLILFSGCTNTILNKQLAQVAKDWCKVIRACQVIPVYPLTEDLQPGDILLVNTPIEEQVKAYNMDGFLPLDQLLARLYPKDFKEFYNSRYGIINDNTIPPAQWQEEDEGGSNDTHQIKHHWNMAPHAAFPPYQFSVKTGSGLNLAIPIQGIPFALGLMKSGKANGTVTIADAYTFGLDIYRLEKEVSDWALKNRNLLSTYGPYGKEHHYLRVISRVYVTGRVDVTLQNAETTGLGSAAGADRPVELAGITDGTFGETVKESIISDTAIKVSEAVNVAASSQFGARIKVATATRRSITFSETFTRPLVIGYVGFDMPILQGGRLGSPISTLDQLKRTHVIPSTSNISDIGQVYRVAAIIHTYNTLEKIEDEEAVTIRHDLDTLSGNKKLLPDTLPFTPYKLISPTEIKIDEFKPDRKTFQGIINYLNAANDTISALERYPNTNSDSQLVQNLQSARKALKDTIEQLLSNPSYIKAVDLVLLGIRE